MRIDTASFAETRILLRTTFGTETADVIVAKKYVAQGVDVTVSREDFKKYVFENERWRAAILYEMRGSRYKAEHSTSYSLGSAEDPPRRLMPKPDGVVTIVEQVPYGMASKKR